MGFTVNISDLLKKLDSLDKKVKRKVIARTLRKCAGAVKKTLKASIGAKDTGNLKESIDYKVTTKKEGRGWAQIGASSKKKKDAKKKEVPTRYFHLQEEAQKDVDNALKANQNRIIEIIADETKKEF